MSKENQESNLRSKVFKGLRWSALRKGSQAIFSFIVPIILARLLVPDDFGLVAMATVFTGISKLIIDFGTGAAIIQKGKSDIYFQSSIFWFNLMLGLIIWLAVIIAAPYIAQIYNRPIVKQIIYIQSFSILIQSINIVPSALLKKELHFFPIAIAQVSSQLVGAITAITMAVLGFGLWSLVFYGLISTIIFTIILWLSASWKPKLLFRKDHIREILRFSSYLTATKFFNYFQRMADKFIIGYYLGGALLGLYSKAYGLLMKPKKTISGFVGPVIFPTMSKVKNEQVKLQSLYLKTNQALAMIYYPLAVILIIFAKPIVLVILGEQWRGIIPLVQTFAVIFFYQPLHKVNPEILKTLGRTDVMFKLNAIFSIVAILGFMIGVRFGIYGVGVSYALTSLLLFVTSNYITMKMIKIKISDFFINIKNVIIQSFILSVIMVLFNKLIIANQVNFNWIMLLAILFIGVAFYLALQFILPIMAFNHLMEFLNISSHKVNKLDKY